MAARTSAALRQRDRNVALGLALLLVNRGKDRYSLDLSEHASSRRLSLVEHGCFA
jgi:hypothetical protein